MMGYNRPGAGRISADDLGPKKAGQKAGDTFRQAREKQQGASPTGSKKSSGEPGEIPAPDVPKIRPVFVEDKKSSAEPR